MLSNRNAVGLTGVLLLLHLYYFTLSPSEDMVAFVQITTATRLTAEKLRALATARGAWTFIAAQTSLPTAALTIEDAPPAVEQPPAVVRKVIDNGAEDRGGGSTQRISHVKRASSEHRSHSSRSAPLSHHVHVASVDSNVKASHMDRADEEPLHRPPRRSHYDHHRRRESSSSRPNAPGDAPAVAVWSSDGEAAGGGVAVRNAAGSPDPFSPVASPTAMSMTVQYQLGLSRRRISAKHRMVCPFQMYVDYPLSYWIAVTGPGIAFWPGVTPNLISLIHPICGTLAGILIFRAAKDVGSNSGGVGTTSTASPTVSRSTNRPSHRGRTASQAMSPMDRAPSSGPEDASAGGGSDPLGESDPNAASGSNALLANDGGGAVGCNAVGFTTAASDGGEVSNLVVVDAELGESAHAKKFRDVTQREIDVRMLRIGAVLFAARNVLDTLDGVIARSQLQSKIAQVATFGLNGHTIDVMTDFFGCFVGGLGIMFFLLRLDLRVKSPFVVSVFHRLGMNERNIHLNAGRFIAILGCMLPGFVAIFWEFFMVRFTNVFDLNILFDPTVIPWDSSWWLRVSQFGWAVISGDSIFYFFIIAALMNRTWSAVQTAFFVGYPVLVVWSVYSLVLWNGFVSVDPNIAKWLVKM